MAERIDPQKHKRAIFVVRCAIYSNLYYCFRLVALHILSSIRKYRRNHCEIPEQTSDQFLIELGLKKMICPPGLARRPV